jgi:hypothetical protein
MDHNFCVKQELWQIGEKTTTGRILKRGVTNYTNKEAICLTVLTRGCGLEKHRGRTSRDERKGDEGERERGIYEQREKVLQQRAK